MVSPADFVPAAFIELEVERQLRRLSVDKRFKSHVLETTHEEGWTGYSMLLIIQGVGSFFGIINDDGFNYIGDGFKGQCEPTARVIIRDMWVGGKHYSAKEVLWKLFKYQKDPRDPNALSPYLAYMKNGVDVKAEDGRLIFHANNMTKFFDLFEV